MPGPRAARRQTVNGSWRKAAGPDMSGPYMAVNQNESYNRETAGGDFMKRTSMYTAVLALSLAMVLAGGGLACRTFRERLDALEEQAVLQHQRNVCGLEDAFAAEYDTRSGAGYLSSGADSVCARVG